MGRHREFDVDKALNSAMNEFWRKGYEGTSYSDLTKVTGVERPALYSAFGNKESLFRLALSRYYENQLSFFQSALEQPTSRLVIEHMLRGAAELHTKHNDRKGCLGIHGALAGSDSTESIQQMLIEARSKGEDSLRNRLKQAKETGDLPENTNYVALASFVMAVLHGMAVQAKSGFERSSLEATVEQVIAMWPDRAES